MIAVPCALNPIALPQAFDLYFQIKFLQVVDLTATLICPCLT